MKHHLKNTLFYIGTIGGFSILMYWIVLKGKAQEVTRNIVPHETGTTHWQEFTNSFTYNMQHPLAILLLQIVIIIVAARFFGWLFKKIGQPMVIGEIIAGIVLGPSLLGMYFPEISAAIFPVQSLGNINILSQIGLIFFMFVVGMEIDLKVLRSKAHDAVVISHASIIIPFALGMGLAYFIYTNFSPEGVKFSSFALFLGIAMSITAFPVLARIVQERGLNKTKIGTVVITCAAADDITAWCLLAAVIAIVKAGSFVSALYTIALAVLYVLVMIKMVRPFLKRIGDLHTSIEKLSKPIVAIFFLTIILSAYTTEIIGIHALFGAFMAGAIMPENTKFRHLFIEKVEDIALVLLLPLFFVYTGLRTEIGLLNEPYLWQITGLIILVAVIGKFFGSAIAARFVGQSWKDSLTIGALMNTRGLMELVVLNIGYDLGVLTPEVFAMMVIMALVTTFMTGPALNLFNRVFKQKYKTLVPSEIIDTDKFEILLSFGNPERGKSLLRMASAIIRKGNGDAGVTALHLTPAGEMHHYNEDHFEQESFAPINEEAEKLDQHFTPLFEISNDIDIDIVETANKGDYDLLLVGVGESIYEGSTLGRIIGFTKRVFKFDWFAGKKGSFVDTLLDERTRFILSKSKIPVGILIDRQLSKTDKILLPLFSESDASLFQYAQKLISNAESHIILFDAVQGGIKNNPKLNETLQGLLQIAPHHVHLVSSEESLAFHFLKQYDLMLISIEGWEKFIGIKPAWHSAIPSAFIVRE